MFWLVRACVCVCVCVREKGVRTGEEIGLCILWMDYKQHRSPDLEHIRIPYRTGPVLHSCSCQACSRDEAGKIRSYKPKNIIIFKPVNTPPKKMSRNQVGQQANFVGETVDAKGIEVQRRFTSFLNECVHPHMLCPCSHL